MSDCEICGRKVEKIYCSYHQQAHSNLQDTFAAWQNALEIDWQEYLKSVLDTEEAGTWVREVIEHLLSQDSTSE